LDNVNEMHRLLKSLSEFSGPERPHLEYLDIHQSLSQVLAFVVKEAEGRKVKIETDFRESLPISADHKKLKQVFLNFFKNALEAMPEGGRLSVKTRLASGDFSEKKSGMTIQISDTGVGIAQEEIDFIFRPFYSTKKGGTGLGLSFCQRIIEEHGGEITVDSQIGRGTTFTILLPLKREREKIWTPAG
ncbi:MAG: GHKL domain-containing protein, partial [Candidatus Tectomicrobia bacterium]|nr:GHKL domain-containing protein [Candidatus Tectomicrobia bacterium]